jgi:hypothetical protein
MVNERERDAVSDVSSSWTLEPLPKRARCLGTLLVYSTRAAASLAKYFLGRRDSVGVDRLRR